MSQSKITAAASSFPHQVGEAFGEPLLRAEQVAEMLNVKVSTVYEWVRMNYLPSIRLGTGDTKPLVRFERSAIEQWLETKRKAGRSRRIGNLN